MSRIACRSARRLSGTTTVLGIRAEPEISQRDSPRRSHGSLVIIVMAVPIVVEGKGVEHVVAAALHRARPRVSGAPVD
jgi:hypothetical protein